MTLSAVSFQQTMLQYLLIGASAGIGEGIALHFASLGAQLSLTGRNSQELSRVASLCQQHGAKDEQVRE